MGAQAPTQPQPTQSSAHLQKEYPHIEVWLQTCHMSVEPLTIRCQPKFRSPSSTHQLSGTVSQRRQWCSFFHVILHIVCAVNLNYSGCWRFERGESADEPLTICHQCSLASSTLCLSSILSMQTNGRYKSSSFSPYLVISQWNFIIFASLEKRKYVLQHECIFLLLIFFAIKGFKN